MGIFNLALTFEKQVNSHLEKRGALTWDVELDPTDNCHSTYPVLTKEGGEVFKEKQELFKRMNCLLCRAKHGPCQAESCFFKSEEGSA